jgi:hypothetical protein
MKTISLIIFGLFIIFIPDWSFLTGKITHYEVVYYDLAPKKCEPVSVTSYLPITPRRSVLAENYKGQNEYPDCKIIDRKNWTCPNPDSSSFGFVNGIYFYNKPENNGIVIAETAKYISVSKIQYFFCSLTSSIGK